MGSPEFAVPSLEALVNHYSVVGVVTQPDRPAGRSGQLKPPPVKSTAQALGIPIIQPERLRHPGVLEQLTIWAPDLIVVVAFGQILRSAVLDLPPFGCINVHGSLLPRWRGAAPIQAALLAGDEKTGITVMKMDPGVDTGPILNQQPIPIAPDETGGSLFSKMSQVGAELLIDTLPGYLRGEIVPRIQTEDGATYAPMLKKEDGYLDFSKSAMILERQVRALHPWPGTFFTLNDAPCKVLRACTTNNQSPGVGIRLVHKDLPAIGTSDGILLLEEVQPSGKKPMPGKAFLAGYRNWT